MKIKIYGYKPVDQPTAEALAPQFKRQPTLRSNWKACRDIFVILLGFLVFGSVVFIMATKCFPICDDGSTSSDASFQSEAILGDGEGENIAVDPASFEEFDEDYFEHIKKVLREQRKQELALAKEGACDKTKSCLANYYSVWEIDASKTLPPYVDYFHKLQDNFEHIHEFAIDLICVAQDELDSCMGGDIDLDVCLTVNGYSEMFGIGKNDAREYAADLRVRTFECKNQIFLKENFGCLYPTTQKRKDDLDVCSAELRKAIEEKREPCESMDEYISCSRKIFVFECGNKVSGFVCRLIQTAIGFNYPACSSSFQTCE
ncbi:hypothetical protein PMAYCL1PPCAC_21783 [Pristionchus mayeri]|uniref:DUF19 domain-containing protein n=1 Tax=Pristionchus mayeri TaxID=1317129 RepID=A0AAN5CVD7_9BILA|nr:hypothetical protein PMAYCL1PPCAC_21783 [Pristionchus mayeri]